MVAGERTTCSSHPGLGDVKSPPDEQYKALDNSIGNPRVTLPSQSSKDIAKEEKPVAAKILLKNVIRQRQQQQQHSHNCAGWEQQLRHSAQL